MPTKTPLLNPAADPINGLLGAHGLRRTAAARLVLGWFLTHDETSYTHAQLQAALESDSALAPCVKLDRVTLYRLIDRLTQVGLLLCRVDLNRVRRYQAVPTSVQPFPTLNAKAATVTAP